MKNIKFIAILAIPLSVAAMQPNEDANPHVLAGVYIPAESDINQIDNVIVADIDDTNVQPQPEVVAGVYIEGNRPRVIKNAVIHGIRSNGNARVVAGIHANGRNTVIRGAVVSGVHNNNGAAGGLFFGGNNNQRYRPSRPNNPRTQPKQNKK